jgi:hypothetical protein
MLERGLQEVLPVPPDLFGSPPDMPLSDMLRKGPFWSILVQFWFFFLSRLKFSNQYSDLSAVAFFLVLSFEAGTDRKVLTLGQY